MYSENYLIPEWRTAEKKAIRSGVGEGLVAIGAEHEDVVVLTADLAESTRVREFADCYPERFFDVGVAEQNMIGVAAGLANERFVPFAVSYATFSPGRSWEQIRVSVCLSKANVKIVGAHAGIATGLNGPSHQATEDMAIMRVLPEMKVIVPADYTQAKMAVAAAYAHPGPVYIRATRPETPNFTQEVIFEIGKAQIYREGKDVTICACGIQVYDSLVVAEELSREGIECEVINVSSIKPIDSETILASAAKTRRVITIEDHQIEGGMGSAVSEIVSEKYPVPVKRIGIVNKFGMSGEFGDMYKAYGLDRVSIKKSVVDWLHGKL